MSDSSNVLNSSESEPALSEGMSGEEAEGSGDSEIEAHIPGHLSRNSRSSNEEIFSFDTRGRTKIVKKKPRLESSVTKVSRVATKKQNLANLQCHKRKLPLYHTFRDHDRDHLPLHHQLAHLLPT